MHTDTVASTTRPSVNTELLNAEFDTRLHRRMNNARSEQDWDELLEIIAKAHQNKNLRVGVRDRFVNDCPYPQMVNALFVGLGIRLRRAKDKPSPLGNKTKPGARQESERRRAARRIRDARLCPKFINGHGKKNKSEG